MDTVPVGTLSPRFEVSPSLVRRVHLVGWNTVILLLCYTFR